MFTLVMVQQDTAPVVAVAVVSGALLTAALALLRTRRAAEALTPDPDLHVERPADNPEEVANQPSDGPG